MRLDEIIGNLKKEKEEEPEGELLGDSDTGSLLFPPLFTFLLIRLIFVSVCTASIFYNFPLQMNLKKRDGKVRPLTKEEEDVDVIRS